MLRTKFIIPKTTVLDQQAGRVHAVVSTEAKDRDGDIIRAAGWQLDNFMAHPVLLSSHNYIQLRSQIGEWESMDIKTAGRGSKSRLEGVARYYVGEGNQEADWAFNLAGKGRAAFSVGFIPDMAKAKELEGTDGLFPSYEFQGQELLEVSQVTIPSNPQALQSLKGFLRAAGGHPGLEELLDVVAGEMPAPEANTDATVQGRFIPLDALNITPTTLCILLRGIIREELDREPLDRLAVKSDIQALNHILGAIQRW